MRRAPKGSSAGLIRSKRNMLIFRSKRYMRISKSKRYMRISKSKRYMRISKLKPSMDQSVDQCLLSQSAGRDPQRSPMQWTGDMNAGFNDITNASWLPVHPNYTSVNVEVRTHTAKDQCVYFTLGEEN